MSRIGTVLCLVLALTSCAFAHTWLGCTKMVNGVCQGYIRNYKGRDTGSTAVDLFYTNKALGRPSEFEVCKSDTQQQKIYTAQYPMAKAYPGEELKVMYTPNGHSQPGDRGLQTTSRIHWTGSPNTQLYTRADLVASPKVGEWPYGQNCATTGDVASLPCVNGFTIPTGTAPGVYQFVWYWPYDSNQAQSPIGEEYFSCFEVEVLGNGAATPTSQNTPTQQTSQQTSQPTSQQTSRASTPTSQNTQIASSAAAFDCSSMLDDCKSFCGDSPITACECDPTSGKKSLKCGSEDTSSATIMTFGLPVALLIVISNFF